MRQGLGSALAGFQESAFHSGGVARLAVGLPFGRRRWSYTVREPELIREVLVDRSRDFPKSRLMDQMLRPLIGASVFLVNGETWRWRRAIVDQALAQARVAHVFEAMREAADVAVQRIAAQAGREVRIDQEMTRFAADIIFRTLMSEPITDAQSRRIIGAFERFQGVAYAQGVIGLYGLPAGVLLGALRQRLSARTIRAVLRPALRRRLSQAPAGADEAPSDILASLIAASDPVTGRRFSPAELLDEMAMIFLAGHETSAAALGWALYLLASDPAAQATLRAEAVAVLGEGAPAFSDMRRLTYARDVFRETLRLYPPVAVLARDAACPHAMGGREIAGGSAVFVAPWIMHRQARFWSEPHAFRPARFATPEGQAALRQAYLPFSMGPRVCPGAAFALQEAALLLSMLARRFEFHPAPGHPPRPVARLTLRSANGVRLVARDLQGA
jgi:cytochrome P450